MLKSIKKPYKLRTEQEVKAQMDAERISERQARSETWIEDDFAPQKQPDQPLDPWAN